MTYKDLLQRIAEATQLDPEQAAAVLKALPAVLITTEEGEQTRTPLGTFHTGLRKGRSIKLPNGKTSSVAEQRIVRLKPGVNLRKNL